MRVFICTRLFEQVSSSKGKLRFLEGRAQFDCLCTISLSFYLLLIYLCRKNALQLKLAFFFRTFSIAILPLRRATLYIVATCAPRLYITVAIESVSSIETWPYLQSNYKESEKKKKKKQLISATLVLCVKSLVSSAYYIYTYN